MSETFRIGGIREVTREERYRKYKDSQLPHWSVATVFCKKRCSYKFYKTHRKTPDIESFLIKLQGWGLQLY